MDISNLDFNQATGEDICKLIDSTLSGNNQLIANATKILKAYTKHKASIRVLTYILTNSPNFAHRQMSTILLKRNIVNLYESLQANEKSEFRAVLLNQYVNQSALPVQRGIALLIGMLLPVIELKNWPQLQNLLDQAIRSAPQSVATFILLNCLLYHFKAPQQLYNYLLNALKIQNLAQQASKCLVSVSETQNIDQLFAIQLIKLWQQSNWPQQVSLNCLSVLTTLAQRRVKLNEQIISWVCVHIISNKKLSTKFRVSGLDFLSAYAEFNGRSLSNKEQLLRKVVETICLVCSEPFNQQEHQEQGEPVQQIALWLIQTLAISLKSKKIYPILLQASTALINSEDINQINTGFLLLGGMAEGCSQKLKKNLENPVMNVLIPKGLNNPAPEVRGAAINALSYFSEYLIPDIVKFHATIIPAMMNYVNDASQKVAQKALIAIDVFFDNMQEDQIKQYLPIVIPKLAQVLGRQQSSPMMRNVAMSGIGSTIQASKVKFQPFVQNVYQMCIQFLNVPPSPQMNSVRAQNLTVLGKLANIFCGKDYENRENFYKNYMMPIMEHIYKMLVNQTDPQIRECCFQFFYLIANAVETVFQPIFDQIIPQVFKSATLKVPESKQNKKQFSLDSDSQQQDYMSPAKAMEYDQKSAAIRAMGQFANACPNKFTPYFDQAYKVLEDHHNFFYDTVRIQVSSCYVNIIKAYIKSQNNGVLPIYQNGLPCIQRYPQSLQKYFKNQLVPRMIFMMTEDDSSRASSAAITAFNDLIKAVGPVLIDQSLDNITKAMITLFQSQISEEDSQQQQQKEDDQDVDAYIFEPLCADLIPTICQVLQVAYLPYINQLQPYMMKFLQERQDINDNVQMAGSLSQCFKYIPSFFSSHADEFFKALASLTQLQETDLDRNIAYCFAQAIQGAPQAMQNYLNHALIILKNIYQNKTSDQACKENALAAICRSVIVFNPPLPYEQFIANLVQSMPFSGDQQEQSTALRLLMYLYHKNTPLVQNHAETIKKILQNDLQTPKKYKLTGQLLQDAKAFYNALQ